MRLPKVNEDKPGLYGCLWVFGALLFAPFFAVRAMQTASRNGNGYPAGKAVGLFALSCIPTLVIVGILGLLAWAGDGDGYARPSSDQRAYEALRARGFSDAEARKLAPSIRKLCESQGGDDCR